jgi:Mn-dependent DtxR family transcriptional regulator
MSLSETFGGAIADLERLGLVVPTEAGIRLSARGAMLANDVVARFL